jgi:hypothetical protein
MHKAATRVGKIELVQVDLADVGKGRMPHIVTESNGLDQVKVQIQRAADGSRNTGNQLYVQASARDVIVLDQRKDLGLVGVSVVIRGMQYSIYIVSEGGTPDALAVRVCIAPAYDIGITHSYPLE